MLSECARLHRTQTHCCPLLQLCAPISCTGLQYSEIKCETPGCSGTSTPKFEPFLSLALALPVNDKRLVRVLFVQVVACQCRPFLRSLLPFPPPTVPFPHACHA